MVEPVTKQEKKRIRKQKKNGFQLVLFLFLFIFFGLFFVDIEKEFVREMAFLALKEFFFPIGFLLLLTQKMTPWFSNAVPWHLPDTQAVQKEPGGSIDIVCPSSEMTFRLR